MLGYALGSDSFLAGSGASTSVTNVPPANPSLGEEWWSTSNTAAPYAKNTLYKYNGTSWVYVSGRPETVATSTGVRDVALGSGATFDDLPLSVVTNNLNTTATANGVVIAEAGVYHVEAMVNPGSLITTHEATDWGVALYSLGIRVNGGMHAETTNVNFINSAQSHMLVTVLGASCGTFLTVTCNAGDVISPTIYIAGLALSYSLTLKVARVG